MKKKKKHLHTPENLHFEPAKGPFEKEKPLPSSKLTYPTKREVRKIIDSKVNLGEDMWC